MQQTSNKPARRKRPGGPRPRLQRPTGRFIPLQEAEASSGIPYTSLRDLGLRGQLTLHRFGDLRRLYLDRLEFERFLATK